MSLQQAHAHPEGSYLLSCTSSSGLQVALFKLGEWKQEADVKHHKSIIYDQTIFWKLTNGGKGVETRLQPTKQRHAAFTELIEDEHKADAPHHTTNIQP